MSGSVEAYFRTQEGTNNMRYEKNTGNDMKNNVYSFKNKKRRGVGKRLDRSDISKHNTSFKSVCCGKQAFKNGSLLFIKKTKRMKKEENFIENKFKKPYKSIKEVGKHVKNRTYNSLKRSKSIKNIKRNNNNNPIKIKSNNLKYTGKPNSMKANINKANNTKQNVYNSTNDVLIYACNKPTTIVIKLILKNKAGKKKFEISNKLIEENIQNCFKQNCQKRRKILLFKNNSKNLQDCYKQIFSNTYTSLNTSSTKNKVICIESTSSNFSGFSKNFKQNVVMKKQIKPSFSTKLLNKHSPQICISCCLFSDFHLSKCSNIFSRKQFFSKIPRFTSKSSTLPLFAALNKAGRTSKKQNHHHHPQLSLLKPLLTRDYYSKKNMLCNINKRDNIFYAKKEFNISNKKLNKEIPGNNYEAYSRAKTFLNIINIHINNNDLKLNIKNIKTNKKNEKINKMNIKTDKNNEKINKTIMETKKNNIEINEIINNMKMAKSINMNNMKINKDIHKAPLNSFAQNNQNTTSPVNNINNKKIDANIKNNNINTRNKNNNYINNNEVNNKNYSYDVTETADLIRKSVHGGQFAYKLLENKEKTDSSKMNKKPSQLGEFNRRIYNVKKKNGKARFSDKNKNNANGINKNNKNYNINNNSTNKKHQNKIKKKIIEMQNNKAINDGKSYNNLKKNNNNNSKINNNNNKNENNRNHQNKNNSMKNNKKNNIKTSNKRGSGQGTNDRRKVINGGDDKKFYHENSFARQHHNFNNTNNNNGIQNNNNVNNNNEGTINNNTTKNKNKLNNTKANDIHNKGRINNHNSYVHTETINNNYNKKSIKNNNDNNNNNKKKKKNINTKNNNEKNPVGPRVMERRKGSDITFIKKHLRKRVARKTIHVEKHNSSIYVPSIHQSIFQSSKASSYFTHPYNHHPSIYRPTYGVVGSFDRQSIKDDLYDDDDDRDNSDNYQTKGYDDGEVPSHGYFYNPLNNISNHNLTSYPRAKDWKALHINSQTSDINEEHISFSKNSNSFLKSPERLREHFEGFLTNPQGFFDNTRNRVVLKENEASSLNCLVFSSYPPPQASILKLEI